MILVSDIVATLVSRLDAQGSDYYNFTDNFKPAINESVSFIVSLIDYAVEQNKFTTEVLYPLQKALVVQLSRYSRFTFDDKKIWAIRSINPLPKTEVNPDVQQVVQIRDYVSIERPDLIHISTNYFCQRLTKEEWEANAQNPFKPGNIVMKCSTLQEGSNDKGNIVMKFSTLQEGSNYNVRFGYLNPHNYGTLLEGEGEDETANEIEIRPYIPKKLCTLFYVARPTAIDSESDEIGLHFKLYNFLVEKCLQYISYQQGDNTNIFSLSTKEINNIVTILS